MEKNHNLISEKDNKQNSFLTKKTQSMETTNVNEEPTRHHISPLLSPTKSTRLTMGSRVIILGTDNVEQRVPQYVGLEAEIVVVPGTIHV